MIRGIKIEGIEKLMAKCKGLSLALESENRNVFDKEAIILKSLIRSKVPVRRGKIKAAIRIKKWKDKDGVVGYVVGITKESNIPEFTTTSKSGKGGYYPAAQEYGWTTRTGYHNPGQPYLRPSFDMRKNAIRANAKKAYRKVIERKTA